MVENNINTSFKEDEGVVKVEKPIKKCDEDNLFSFLLSHFSQFFIDIQELKIFIRYLKDNKGDLIIKSLLDNFDIFLKAFRNKK